MKNFACYPAILKETGGMYKVSIPIGHIETEGKTIHDVIRISRDALGTYLNEIQELPELVEVEPGINEKVIYIDVNLDWYDQKMKYKSITRAVTLPYYLNELVKESGINVSAVLQEALMKKLQIHDKNQ